MKRPDITFDDILAHADAFRAQFGRWPRRDDGPVAGVPDLTWSAIDQALKKGHRNLPPGSTLAKLLLRCRGRRHGLYPPDLSVEQVLVWVDAHHARTGEWPTDTSGAIRGTNGETWQAVDKALRVGRRGLLGNSSLAQLLEEHRGVRNHLHAPALPFDLVLAWADAHHLRTDSWPTRTSGRVAEAPEETWHAIDAAFVAGARGLAGYGSLARFLARHRGVRNRAKPPGLSVEQICQWLRAYYEEHGRWPTHTSGSIEGVPGETWGAVHSALVRGRRGLTGGSSLYRIRDLLSP
jgi:hypothetical protein